MSSDKLNLLPCSLAPFSLLSSFLLSLSVCSHLCVIQCALSIWISFYCLCMCVCWFSLVLRINYAYLWVSSPPSSSSSACPACSLLLLLSVLGEALISSGISTPPQAGRHFYGVSNCQQNVVANEGRRREERDAMTWRAKSKNNCQVNCENC